MFIHIDACWLRNWLFSIIEEDWGKYLKDTLLDYDEVIGGLVLMDNYLVKLERFIGDFIVDFDQTSLCPVFEEGDSF